MLSINHGENLRVCPRKIDVGRFVCPDPKCLSIKEAIPRQHSSSLVIFSFFLKLHVELDLDVTMNEHQNSHWWQHQSLPLIFWQSSMRQRIFNLARAAVCVFLLLHSAVPSVKGKLRWTRHTPDTFSKLACDIWNIHRLVGTIKSL
jgi:hypothetical protein